MVRKWTMMSLMRWVSVIGPIRVGHAMRPLVKNFVGRYCVLID